MARPDFIAIRLTAHGAQLAANSSLSISAGKRSFTFKPGEEVEVERSFEWNVLLRNKRSQGGLLFEEVPASPTMAAAAPAAKAATAPAPAPPAAVSSPAVATANTPNPNPVTAASAVNAGGK